MTNITFAVMPDSVFFVSPTSGPKMVTKDHPRFGDIADCLKADGDPTDLVDVNVAKLSDRFAVEDGVLLLDGKPLEDVSLGDFVVGLVEYGEGDPAPFFGLVASLDRNPSLNSRTQLFSFTQRHGIALYEDGRLRLFKSLRPDFTDWHTGTVDNRVGATPPRMKRRDVDDSPAHPCSKGYHAGSFDFASAFGDDDRRLVAVAVAAEDVVSVPLDSDCAKVRVVGYEVKEDVTDRTRAYRPVHHDEVEPLERYRVEVDVECDDGITMRCDYTVEAPDRIAACSKATELASAQYPDALSWRVVSADQRRYRVVQRYLRAGLDGYLHDTREVEEEEDAGWAAVEAAERWADEVGIDEESVETVSVTEI